MEPTIPVGSMVILSPVAANDIHVGDIIAYNNGNVEICHRVIALEEGSPVRFIMKGDRNGSPDGIPVAPDKVTGKLVVVVPLAGYLVHFMKTPLGLFLTVMLPLLFIIGIELKSIIFDKKETESSRDSK
jgi:signal peptidase